MITSRPLRYDADGASMIGWLTYDQMLPGPLPGALVFPAMPGLGQQVKTSANLLAQLGFAALACDYYGEGRYYDNVDEGVGPLTALRTRLDGVRGRGRAALDALAAQPFVDRKRLVALGYCFGGVMALELARSGAPLAAVAGFHTPLKTTRPEDARNIKGKVLVCTGAEDREAALADRAAFEQEMRAGGVDFRLHVYGGVYHSFTNPEADSYGKPDYARYNPVAHARSWHEMLALFEEAFAAA